MAPDGRAAPQPLNPSDCSRPIADIPMRRHKCRMEPPWQKYPELPAGSIGWRMGRGEDYYNDFYKWFSGLLPSEQEAYALANEPPRGWLNLYDTIRQHPWC